MNFCPECGIQVDPNDIFCPNCRYILLIPKLKNYCPKCGYKVNPNWKICSSCNYTYILTHKTNFWDKGFILILLGIVSFPIFIILMIPIAQSHHSGNMLIALYLLLLPLIIPVVLGIMASEDYNRPLIQDRRAFLKAQPFVCNNCKKFTNILREYCENCGSKDSLRKATKEDYLKYVREE